MAIGARICDKPIFIMSLEWAQNAPDINDVT